MAIFHCYVSSPEGIPYFQTNPYDHVPLVETLRAAVQVHTMTMAMEYEEALQLSYDIMGTSLEYVGNIIYKHRKNHAEIYIYVIYIYIPPISNTAYSWVQICVNPQQNTKVSGAC